MTADRTHSSFRYRDDTPTSLRPSLPSPLFPFTLSHLLSLACCNPSRSFSHSCPTLLIPPLLHNQVVRILRDEFALAGLPIYLVPYSVVPSRTGNDNAPGGIIQVLRSPLIPSIAWSSYCAVLCCTVLHCTVLYCNVPHSLSFPSSSTFLINIHLSFHSPIHPCTPSTHKLSHPSVHCR